MRKRLLQVSGVDFQKQHKNACGLSVWRSLASRVVYWLANYNFTLRHSDGHSICRQRWLHNGKLLKNADSRMHKHRVFQSLTGAMRSSSKPSNSGFNHDEGEEGQVERLETHVHCIHNNVCNRWLKAAPKRAWIDRSRRFSMSRRDDDWFRKRRRWVMENHVRR